MVCVLPSRVVVDRALVLHKRRRTCTRLNRAAHQSLGGKQELTIRTVALFSPPQDLDFYFCEVFLPACKKHEPPLRMTGAHARQHYIDSGLLGDNIFLIEI